ncbi:E3 ubiquitin-protein ligase TRIM39-like isoform X2 [Heterodontus francisci]|uniref:E3 ubiquitin-protein ligase TRIM39-like isoform X2 n=1 Tax=Heterodontus francisci TaxID=7792 RepID=UPI00355BC626
MATEKDLENLINEAICSICLEFYQEPVMIDCGHNFCKACILNYWDKQKEIASCPKCREEVPQRNIRLNRFAANMVESVRKISLKPKEGNVLRCDLHDEKLKLFCEDDKSAICVVCAVSHEHKNHKISPLKDVAEVYKKQADAMRKNIESEFAKLRQYLRDEEKVLMGKIKKKEDSILQHLEANLKAAVSERALMNQRISNLQERMTLQDAEILKDIKSLLEGAEAPHIKTAETHLNMNLYEPIGPLQYIVWKRMLKVINPVPALLTLDPQTAHPRLVLSDDDTQVRRGEWRKVPEYPERFNFLLSVLATQGFTAGRHYWEVDVGNNTAWDVGAAKASVARKAIPENGVWAVGLWDKEYTAFTNPRTVLQLGDLNPKRVGVYLDYEEGQVSIYNADTMAHIYSFSETFTETVYPYFSTESKTEPLKLVALQL